ncbi:MAG: hypothetical protein FWD34_07765 [Oscillospiraceae bacterium]|nr:hypothetical protein [Oscillospiraceae bacterium]
MSDNIKFDFARAQELLKLLNKCENELNNMVQFLDTEVDNLGQWWKGESYEVFSKTYKSKAGGKYKIKKVSAKAASVKNHLSKLSDTKKDFERKTAKQFR